MEKLALSSLVLVSISLYGCREEVHNVDAVAAADAGVIWTGNSACDGCLQVLCSAPDGGENPYRVCEQQSSCKTAMSRFASCYANRPNLADCSSEMSDLRNTGDSGSHLLDCFLLKCFFTVCETVRSVENSHRE